MNHIPTPSSTPDMDRFARRLAAHLSTGTEELPYDISERLRAARVQALARRKKPVTVLHTSPAVLTGGHSAALGGGPQGLSWWQSLLSALPVVALLAGLVIIQQQMDEAGIHEVAQVDAALLADDLPPAAYSDPGFVQYLKTSGNLSGQ
ncbi:MAG: DUF3619 family protein [Burkholderiales bacterium]|uniref:DUF3619 family protein n=1 Tax=Comamonas granuli TaxID=290309 RepID=UPI0005A9C4A5|nr:DUF3619 family protein [Comamonas granuli]MCZ2405360.1 DUF3619 family protein [Burkholderiales bacterium]